MSFGPEHLIVVPESADERHAVPVLRTGSLFYEVLPAGRRAIRDWHAITFQ